MSSREALPYSLHEDLFDRHFIDTGLVRAEHRGLVSAARGAAGAQADLDPDSSQVAAFVDAVQDLYDNMDPSLRFRPAESAPSADEAPKHDESASEPGGSAAAADAEADFRGVVCPLNYVKTKLLLDKMDKGQVLSILLDEEGRHLPGQISGGSGHLRNVQLGSCRSTH